MPFAAQSADGISASTSISVSSINLTAGQSLRLNAEVMAASGATPTGNVTFFNGTTVLARVSLDGRAKAAASLWPAAGTYSITASYSGDKTHYASTSETIAVTAGANTNNTPYIYTVAGNGTDTFGGDGGPAISAGVVLPWGVRVDRFGHIYVGNGPQGKDNHVRMIDAATGIITTVAGNGVAGYSGDGGPATNAALNNPVDVAVDSKGNLYIADAWNACIRRVDAETQIITTAAGTCGVLGISGDGGPATAAQFILPVGIGFDAADNLYVVDTQTVRKVDAVTGIITRVAGKFPAGVEPSGDGGPATDAVMVYPEGVALDSENNMYIVDSNADQVRMVDGKTGIINTLAGTGTRGFSGDGGPANQAELFQPNYVTVDSAGNVYFSDSANGRIRMVDQKTGIISTFAGGGASLGDGGPAVDAYLSYPTGVAFDGGGNLYIGDTWNHRVRVVGAPPVGQLIPTTTKLKASAASLTAGQSLTLTATVNASSGGTPTGSVRFLDGAKVVGSGTINASGVATLTLTPAVGAYTFKADYAGSTTHQASESAPVNVTVGLATTTTELTASPNPAGVGVTVGLKATVASASATPTGTVTFYDGATALGGVSLASGAATLDVSTLSVGSHHLKAAYGGDANDAPSTSSAVVEVITPADFSISAAPSGRSVYTGEAASYTVAITPSNGFNLPVSLSCKRLPANTTCAFSPATIAPGSGAARLTVQTSPPAQSARATGPWKGFGATALAGLVFLCFGRARRRMSALLGLLVVLVAVASGGCSGPRALVGGTPTGNHAIEISGTAVSGARDWSHATTVTLKVKSLF
jgi:sugar lactone lactonase YvrE